MTCPPHLRAAFLDEPEHITLTRGEHLYKFVSIPIVRQRVLDSPWWIRQQSFDTLRTRAGRLGKPVAALARSQVAIAIEWNPGMDTIYVVVLAADLDGWQGRARSQPVSTRDGTVAFTGGGTQLCVPGLTSSHIALEYSGTATR